MDENPGAVEAFVRERQISLTVLPAYSFINDTLKVSGIPQNWIVDANGFVRLKGWDEATERWESGMTEAIERYKPGAAAH